MTTTAASFWDWSLAVLPFTAITTFIVTIVTCNLVSNYVPAGEYLLQISQLGNGQAYIYFIVGIILIFAQLLALIIGRLQFLLETQSIINRIVLYVIHIITIIPLVFTFIVTIVSKKNQSTTYLLDSYNIFGSISLYCLLHTAVVFYLYLRRSIVSQHSKVIYPIWFLLCSVLLIIFFTIWLQTNRVILGYVAAASHFLYFLGFVPQFWSQAKSKKRYCAVSRIIKNLQ